jgi:hypothetical protein
LLTVGALDVGIELRSKFSAQCPLLGRIWNLFMYITNAGRKRNASGLQSHTAHAAKTKRRPTYIGLGLKQLTPYVTDLEAASGLIGSTVVCALRSTNMAATGGISSSNMLKTQFSIRRSLTAKDRQDKRQCFQCRESPMSASVMPIL